MDKRVEVFCDREYTKVMKRNFLKAFLLSIIITSALVLVESVHADSASSITSIQTQSITIPGGSYTLNFGVNWTTDDVPMYSHDGRIELVNSVGTIVGYVNANVRSPGNIIISSSSGSVSNRDAEITRYTFLDKKVAEGNLDGTWNITGVASGDYTLRFYNYNMWEITQPGNKVGDLVETRTFSRGGGVPLLPDLIASAPVTTAVLEPGFIPFTSKITNQGKAIAKAGTGGIKNIFQVSKSNNGSTKIDGKPSGPTNYEVSTLSDIPWTGANFVTISKSMNLDVGTYYMRVCADATAAGGPSETGATGTVPESDEGNNCSMSTPWTATTITSNFLPNLTAGSASPNIATAGEKKKYTSTIYNIGNIDISPGKFFSYFFQTRSLITTDGEEKETIDDLDSSKMPRIKVDEYDVATSPLVSFADKSDATHKYFIRVCADKESSTSPTPPDPGDIVESNEGDNCGAWAQVTVNPEGGDPGIDPNPVLKKPTVKTNLVDNITEVSAIGGGSIVSDGGSVVTEAGIVWSTEIIPIIEAPTLPTRTRDGTITPGSSWRSNMTELKADTDYNVRAYATNGVGTGYGDNVTFKTDVIPEIAGVCGPTPSAPKHYQCSTSGKITTGTQRVSSPSKWIWICPGSGGGASPTCSEKKQPGFIED